MRQYMPSTDAIEAWVRDTGAVLSPSQIQEFEGAVLPLSDAFRRLDEIAEELELDQSTVREVNPQEAGNDPLRIWKSKFSLRTTDQGSLFGYRVAVKDAIAVAGVPMSAGSDVLTTYVPERDATAVDRVLQAGGEIVGTTVCENLALSGNSHTSAQGPTLNPYDHRRSSGGSSNGSAVAVATGEADVALGGDQGGSVRMPASWVGILGLKPSYGLIPYTGCFPFEKSVDHVGLFAREVSDLGVLLDAVAGPDELDPTATVEPFEGGYAAALTGDTGEIRVGVLLEGFGRVGAEPEVDRIVRDAARSLRDVDCRVEDVSIPAHLDSLPIAAGLSVQGFNDTLLERVRSRSWFDAHLPGITEHLGRGLDEHFASLPPNILRYFLLGSFYADTSQEHFYRRARVLNKWLRAQYDAALDQVDVLCLPTTITTARPIPDPGAGILEHVTAAAEAIVNTAGFNATGHPAISVPCGAAGGLPVGLMFVARRGRDDLALRAAQRLMIARRSEIAAFQP